MREIKTNRCRRCQSVVDKTAAPWLACQTCLLAYHRDCWGDGEVCVDCGGTDYYQGRKLKAPASPKAPKRVPSSPPQAKPTTSGAHTTRVKGLILTLLMMPLSFLSFGFLPILYFEITLLSLVWGQKLGLSQAYKMNGSVSEALEEHRSACFSRGLTKVQDKSIWRIVFALLFASLIYWLFHKEGYVKTRHPRFSTEGGLLFLSVCVITWHVLLRLHLLSYVRACLSVQHWFQEAKAAAYPRYRSDESRLRSLEKQLDNEFESEKLFYAPKSDFFMILLPLFHIVWLPFALQRSLHRVQKLIDDEAV